MKSKKIFFLLGLIVLFFIAYPSLQKAVSSNNIIYASISTDKTSYCTSDSSKITYSLSSTNGKKIPLYVDIIVYRQNGTSGYLLSNREIQTEMQYTYISTIASDVGPRALELKIRSNKYTVAGNPVCVYNVSDCSTKTTNITSKITNNTTYPPNSNSYILNIGPYNINAKGDDNLNLNDEWVSIKCMSGSVNLYGWTIKDGYGWTYYFPNVTIKEGQTIKIYTGCGTDASTSLYWCHDGAIWNNDGDTLKLIKPDGSIYKSWSVN